MRGSPRRLDAATWLTACMALLMAGIAEAGPLEPGNRLPPLHGELLTGRKITLPDSALGSESLLLLGFTYESRHDVEAWAARIRRDFGSDAARRCAATRCR